MAYVAMVDEAVATGRLAEDYRRIPDSYGRLIPEFSPDHPNQRPTPQVYRVGSLVEPYFHMAMLQNRVVMDRSFSEDGSFLPEQGPVPGVLVNFALSMHSSCFY
jgi:hypothetical protein